MKGLASTIQDISIQYKSADFNVCNEPKGDVRLQLPVQQHGLRVTSDLKRWLRPQQVLGTERKSQH